MLSENFKIFLHYVSVANKNIIMKTINNIIFKLFMVKKYNKDV